MTDHHLTEIRHVANGLRGGAWKASTSLGTVLMCAVLGAAAALTGAAASLLVDGLAARLATWVAVAAAAAVASGLWWGFAEFRKDRPPTACPPAARAAEPGSRAGGRR